jgi:DNA-directed RNA polymerase specialized sigma24 family protein
MRTSMRHGSATRQGPDERADGEIAENQRLLAALCELDREQRALLALPAEGYTVAELEAITGHTADVLKAHMYRAHLSVFSFPARRRC